jgi:hypothetical protein
VSSTPKRITIDGPSEAVILAARHLDATEGPVQVGAIVDSATRSAITTVLRYIATAHNNPAAEPGAVHTVVQGRCPACRGSSLFLGDGGHVTCSRLDCPNPTLADEHLHGETSKADVGEIQLTRHLGRGLTVDTAPRRSHITLTVLADAKWGATMASDDQINIADQALYKVVGYDPGTASLIVELVEDWRLAPTAVLAEAGFEELKARWKAIHAKTEPKGDAL